MSLHITVTDENGKRVIDDDTPLLALVWVTKSEPGYSTCGGAALGTGALNQDVALIQTMRSLCNRMVEAKPTLALPLALREALGDKGTEIDVSALLRAKGDVSDSGT